MNKPEPTDEPEDSKTLSMEHQPRRPGYSGRSTCVFDIHNLRQRQMTMSSDDIIHHMACDISQCINDIVPKWPFPGEPADAYTDTVCVVFGDTPTEQSVLETYRAERTAETLRDELNREAERNVVTLKAATKLVQIMIVNNFGPEALG